jgi:hypothetical protein
MGEVRITTQVSFEASTGEFFKINYDNETSPCVRFSITHGIEGEKKFFVMSLYADDLRKLSETIDAMRAMLNR